MRVAIFADVHGKLLLPFVMVDQYQQQTGRKVDFILQCGDLGAFPDLEKLDRATIKHAKEDRDELGFHDFFTQDIPHIRSYLDKLGLQMICVRGNHEDHAFLDQLEQGAGEVSRFPIDVYERVWVCKSGLVQVIEGAEQSLSLVGIGRIGDRKGRENPRFIQDYEKKQIRLLHKRKKMHFDLLITHDKGTGDQPGFGMQEISDLLDQVIFHYQFHGHTGEPYSLHTHENGMTQVCKVNELEFDQQGRLGQGSMVILEKLGPDEFALEVSGPEFMGTFYQYSWKSLIS